MTSIRPVLTVVDPLAVVLAGLLVLPHPRVLPVAAAALAAALVCRGADLHRSRLVLSVLEDLPSLLLAALTATLVLGALNPSLDLERKQVAELAALGGAAFAGMVLLRTGLYAATHLLRRSGLISHPVLIVGAGSIGRKIAETLLTRRELGLRPAGMVDCGPRSDSSRLPVELVGGVDDLDRAMTDLGVDDVVFAFPGPPDRSTMAAMKTCVQRAHQVFVVPRYFELMGRDRHRRTELIGGVAVMRLHRITSSPARLVVLRGLDVVVSLCGLLVLSPVLLLLAAAVRLETGSSSLMRQIRVVDEQAEVLLKFRTLRPPAFDHDATSWSIDNASRTGPVGRLVRAAGLDNLPQLVNVLRGDVSLVGAVRRTRTRREPVRRVVGRNWAGVQADLALLDAGRHPGARFDDLTSPYWSWWIDVGLLVGALRPSRRRWRRSVEVLKVTALDDWPAGGRSWRGREPVGSRRD